jgi:hypothetical protein
MSASLRAACPRLVHAIGLIGFATALAVALAPPAAQAAQTMAMGSMKAMTGSPPSSMSLAARFAYLSRQHSNNCGLQPSAFATMAATSRLQGACCGPMDAKLYPQYLKQIHALARYDHRFVPTDPYNMSVALVRRLVEFNDTILLTPAQQKVFDQAMPLSSDHAPCCCHCWRWVAFEGQAKYFIARRHYTAREIATLWGLDDGCGDTSAGMVMTG